MKKMYAFVVEGLGGAIRQMRTANPRCAVVVALTVNEGQFKDLSAGKTPLAYYGALHYPHAIRLTWGCKPGKHVITTMM